MLWDAALRRPEAISPVSPPTAPEESSRDRSGVGGINHFFVLWRRGEISRIILGLASISKTVQNLFSLLKFTVPILEVDSLQNSQALSNVVANKVFVIHLGCYSIKFGSAAHVDRLETNVKVHKHWRCRGCGSDEEFCCCCFCRRPFVAIVVMLCECPRGDSSLVSAPIFFPLES